ncbi:MAG: hypothetical protein N2322_00075 [Terrimicrobiaceae bacterium]|nr:hypothetical protein [Terrimicrobiaceae bacterium]
MAHAIEGGWDGRRVFAAAPRGFGPSAAFPADSLSTLGHQLSSRDFFGEILRNHSHQRGLVRGGRAGKENHAWEAALQLVGNSLQSGGIRTGHVLNDGRDAGEGFCRLFEGPRLAGGLALAGRAQGFLEGFGLFDEGVEAVLDLGERAMQARGDGVEARGISSGPRGGFEARQRLDAPDNPSSGEQGR